MNIDFRFKQLQKELDRQIEVSYIEAMIGLRERHGLSSNIHVEEMDIVELMKAYLKKNDYIVVGEYFIKGFVFCKICSASEVVIGHDFDKARAYRMTTGCFTGFKQALDYFNRIINA
jgi:hypothetical protein